MYPWHRLRRSFTFRCLRYALVILTCVVLAGIALVGAPAADEARRDRRLQPDRVLDVVGLRPGMVVGEAGAGKGYFTIKLARRVGPTGTVYANDIDASALEALEDRAQREKLTNITTVVGEVSDPLFPEQVDIVFMVYAFHDFDRPVEFLDNLERYLKPGATVVVLDEDPVVTGDHHFLTPAEVLEHFGQAGYERLAVEDFLDEVVLLVFRLPVE